MTKTNPTTEGLVERLRSIGQPDSPYVSLADLCSEAASRIEALEGERIDGFDKLTRVQQIDIERHIRGLSEGPETYNGPRRGWTCFHCGETFKTEAGACLHFGKRVTGRPACLGDRAAIEAAIHKHVKMEWSGRGMSAGHRRVGVEEATDEILASLTASELLVTKLQNQLDSISSPRRTGFRPQP